MKNLTITQILSLLCCASIPLAAVNYDTAWTFVYDGGKQISGSAINDYFYDCKATDDGSCYCVGQTADSANWRGIFLVKLSAAGKNLWQKRYLRSGNGHSLVFARNGDLIIGGARGTSPFVMRTDTAGLIKWSTWYYDSIKSQEILFRSAVVNCIRELSDGNILAVAGDEYPNNGGYNLNNYAALLTLDSTGKVLYRWQWDTPSGNTIGGFYVDVAREGGYLIAGNQSVFCISPTGGSLWKKNYTFSLDGVGTVTNSIMRAKVTRSGAIIVAGQAYEGNCWENYKRLIYDAWWSPISYPDGSPVAWDTAGTQGGDDKIYDFTQLVNGNLVFVGNKHNFSADSGGIWTFVTDSTGKTVLWEKQTKIRYKTDDGRGVTPLSVCATADSGFTVVGPANCNDANGGYNAFAAHFKPAPPVAIPSKKSTVLQTSMHVRVSVTGSRVVFSLPQQSAGEKFSVEVFDGVGRRVASGNGSRSVVWDAMSSGAGVYFWKSVGSVNTSQGYIILYSRK